LIQRLINRMFPPKNLPRSELQEYWRNPDKFNDPVDYLSGAERSRFLCDLAVEYAPPDRDVLEIGCNVGRNFRFMECAGYGRLTGIEINADAVKLMRSTYPTLKADVRVGAVEDVIRGFKNNSFGLVYTMAVLEHIPKESEWVFPEIVRITGDTLITIEDEHERSERHFPRNYKRVFSEMECVHEWNCAGVEGLGKSFMARVFKK